MTINGVAIKHNAVPGTMPYCIYILATGRLLSRGSIISLNAFAQGQIAINDSDDWRVSAGRGRLVRVPADNSILCFHGKSHFDITNRFFISV